MAPVEAAVPLRHILTSDLSTGIICLYKIQLVSHTLDVSHFQLPRFPVFCQVRAEAKERVEYRTRLSLLPREVCAEM